MAFYLACRSWVFGGAQLKGRSLVDRNFILWPVNIINILKNVILVIFFSLLEKTRVCLSGFFKLVLCSVLVLGFVSVRAQQTITGRASYYSDKLHGRPMAGGGLYDKDSMTCAHRNLPFGTLLRVRNIKNGQEVVVEVTDRGPFSNRYVIDVSRVAAQRLGFIKRGWADVEITILQPGVPPFKLEEDTSYISIIRNVDWELINPVSFKFDFLEVPQINR